MLKIQESKLNKPHIQGTINSFCLFTYVFVSSTNSILGGFQLVQLIKSLMIV